MAWSPTSNGRTVPYALQQACFRRDQYQCQHCGYQGTPRAGDLNADHIHNRATGGQDTLDNLRTLCLPCHNVQTQQQARAGRNKWKRPIERHPGLIT